MKLGYVILYVSDVPATVEFYERAFGLTTTFIHESNEYAQMETGSTALAFAAEHTSQLSDLQFRKNRISDVASGFEIAFVADDVARAYAVAIKAGAQPVTEPVQKPWGQTVAYIRDLNGILVELCSPMSA